MTGTDEVEAAMAHDAGHTAQQRLDAVRAAIAAAAARARRKAEDVRLIAVSKTHAAPAILPLLQAGQRAFGENRVQEAQAKWPALREQWADVELHLVGQLQTNKAADAVDLFDVIHGVDRTSLVHALAQAMDKRGRRPACFIQVALAPQDEARGGVAVEQLPALLAEARAADLPVVGLMTVPPPELSPAPWFALLDKLAMDAGLPRRSMGMSGDYAAAVLLGATDVRVGTALFGHRG